MNSRDGKKVSARGVYYDLDLSPYEYEDELGNTFKFSSEKKLDMFILRVKDKQRQFKSEIEHLNKIGYSVNKSYESNIKNLPKIVYNAMIYK